MNARGRGDLHTKGFECEFAAESATSPTISEDSLTANKTCNGNQAGVAGNAGALARIRRSSPGIGTTLFALPFLSRNYVDGNARVLYLQRLDILRAGSR